MKKIAIYSLNKILNQEQASWVCGCSDAAVAELEKSFKGALEQQQGLEGWAAWLKNVVDQRLAPFTNKPDFPQHAKYFLLNWSFYWCVNLNTLFNDFILYSV